MTPDAIANERKLHISAGPYYGAGGAHLMGWVVSKEAVDSIRGWGPTLAEAIKDMDLKLAGKVKMK